MNRIVNIVLISIACFCSFGCYEGKIDVETAIKDFKIQSLAREEMHKLNRNSTERVYESFSVEREGEKWLIVFRRYPVIVNSQQSVIIGGSPVYVYMFNGDTIVSLGPRLYQ